MTSTDDKPQWDDAEAQKLIGKRVLVGLTILDADEELLEQKQFHGTIVDADARRGIGIQLEQGEELYRLPPDLTSVHPAPPGTYRLRSTGEEVVDPDLLSTWTIQKPDKA